ncbi:MAG: YgfZ/GcvT domain-containing protein [Anaerolineae bacterium]
MTVDVHLLLKGMKMLDGWELRLYDTVRDGVAVMDCSAWGRVRMAGEDRVDFLHRMSTNEVRDLAPGMGRRTVLTSDIGRIVAVVTAYALPDHLLLVTEPGGAERVIGHMGRYVFFRDRVEFTDATDETGMLWLCGRRAVAFVKGFVGPAIADLGTDTFIETELDGVATVMVRTEELGLGGVTLFVDRAATEPLLERLLDAGVQLMDASVYDVLRVEAGQPIYGREISEEFNPLEAGLKPMISFTKGCYIGQEVVARLDTYDKVKQQLVGVRLERLPVAEDRPALMSGDDAVGFLTSWVQSPAHGPIALGYVLSKHLEPEMAVQAVDTEGHILGQVVDLPFS